VFFYIHFSIFIIVLESGMRRILNFSLIAEYFQFHIQDDALGSTACACWTQEASENLLAAAPGILCIGTVKTVDIPLTLALCDRPSDVCFDRWDQVNECSVEFASGSVVIFGAEERFEAARRIRVTTGWYRARILYANLASVRADRRRGDDHYKVELWPMTYAPPLVLKRWREAIAA
jgi:hypothetical protein